MGRLTALKVKALTEPGRYGDGDGLWLQVRDPKHRSWLFRYTRHGRARQMGLGEVSGETGKGVSLAYAREAAQRARQLLRDGVDPIDHKKAHVAAQKAAETGGVTFKAVAERFIASHEASWRNPKHRAQWSATLTTYAFPRMGDRPVAEIDTGLVTAVLEPIWHARPETASRLRGRIEQVLDYAAARGWRVGDNPARWRGHLANLLPARKKIASVQHHPALPWTEIGAFMAALGQQVGTASRALEFLILTACRTNEVLGARWAEIDLSAKVWSIPPGRMKAHRMHRVPLSDAAVRLLASLPSDGHAETLVFSGRRETKPLSDMALTMTVRRLNDGELPRWKDGVTGAAIVPHGFRSTFRDWAAERTSFAREVAEAALAHTLSDRVEAAYRRGDLFEKRRRLMQAWAVFCCSRTDRSSVVTSIRREIGAR